MTETQTIPQDPEKAEPDEPVLTNRDRCDRCGPVARAWVRVQFIDVNGELDFCGSCYTQREDIFDLLEASGKVAVIDERSLITSR